MTTPHRKAHEKPAAADSAVRRRTRTISSYPESMFNRMIDGASNVSGRVENMSRRIYQMTMLSLPQLTPSEWAVVMLALREGAGLDDVNAGSRVLAWAHAYGGEVEEMYRVDGIKLARGLAAAGPAANVALAEIAERYWQLPPDMGFVERLELLQLADGDAAEQWNADEERRTRWLRHAMASAGVEIQ